MNTLKVTILTQADCAFCESAKAMLDRLSAEYPLVISTLDLDSREGQALARIFHAEAEASNWCERTSEVV